MSSLKFWKISEKKSVETNSKNELYNSQEISVDKSKEEFNYPNYRYTQTPPFNSNFNKKFFHFLFSLFKKIIQSCFSYRNNREQRKKFIYLNYIQKENRMHQRN